jgi:hypothetical protein
LFCYKSISILDYIIVLQHIYNRVMNVIQIATSKDESMICVAPDGDRRRALWVPANTQLETLVFAAYRAQPKMMPAPWGAGKGVKGGAQGLRRKS